MKNILVLITALCLFLPSMASGAGEGKKSKQELETPSEKFSYALGMDVGKSLRRFRGEVDLDVFVQAIQDSLEGRALLLQPQQAAEIKKEYLTKMQKELAEKNVKEGQTFLAENKKKKGVKTTESGLQYMILKKGDGPQPKVTDKVTVHYRGTLIDGTEFDSSHKRGKPSTFPLKGVIPGWTEGLQHMNVGSTYRLFIPPDLAYGERGAGQIIGPNATLIFEVELISIEQ